jgi:hypothetical protein
MATKLRQQIEAIDFSMGCLADDGLEFYQKKSHVGVDVRTIQSPHKYTHLTSRIQVSNEIVDDLFINFIPYCFMMANLVLLLFAIVYLAECGSYFPIIKACSILPPLILF